MKIYPTLEAALQELKILRECNLLPVNLENRINILMTKSINGFAYEITLGGKDNGLSQ